MKYNPRIAPGLGFICLFTLLLCLCVCAYAVGAGRHTQPMCNRGRFVTEGKLFFVQSGFLMGRLWSGGFSSGLFSGDFELERENIYS